MKTINLLIFCLLLVITTSCEAIGDIFSAGFYTGLALVVAVVVAIIWIARKRG